VSRVFDFWQSEKTYRAFGGIYRAMTWPQISFVAENEKGRIVGYVIAKMLVFWHASRDLAGGTDGRSHIQ
jgi:hypothetical protein